MALEIINHPKNLVKIIETLIGDQAEKTRGPLRILEAGCGTGWPYELKGKSYHLTGLDLDPVALERRKRLLGDLDETIEGDLCTIDLGPGQFDIIYSCYVLEHIKDAHLAMKNMVSWLKPGGAIILIVPDPDGVHGFVTRHTPHWFHILYYRIVLKKKNAGKPGHNPYPVHYHPIVSQKGIRGFIQSQKNLTLEAEYGDGVSPEKGWMKQGVYLFKQILGILSLGRLSRGHTNLYQVIRKSSL